MSIRTETIRNDKREELTYLGQRIFSNFSTVVLSKYQWCGIFTLSVEY